MLLYCRCSNYIALCIEGRRDYGIAPLFALYKYEEEIVINIPYVQLILTLPSALKKESAKDEYDERHERLFKTFARIAKNRPGISASIRGLLNSH